MPNRHANRGELFLFHDYSGVELRQDYARDCLVNLHRLWGRPVHIETVLDNRIAVLTYDGKEHETTKTDEAFYPEEEAIDTD